MSRRAGSGAKGPGYGMGYGAGSDPGLGMRSGMGTSGRSDGGGGDEGMESLLPEGFMDDPSGASAGKAPEKTIERTDFEVHIVFTPQKPGEKKADEKK